MCTENADAKFADRLANRKYRRINASSGAIGACPARAGGRSPLLVRAKTARNNDDNDDLVDDDDGILLMIYGAIIVA